MRFTEFGLLTEMVLNEVNMSPSALKKMAASIPAKAGMEFEMIVPNVASEEDAELEPDYDSYDELARSFVQVENFFLDGDYNSRGDVERLMNSLQGQFSEWVSENAYSAWEDRGREYFNNWADDQFDEETMREEIEEKIRDKFGDLDDDEVEERVLERLEEVKQEWLDEEWESQGWVYRKAEEAFLEEFYDDPGLDEDDFFRNQGIRYLSEIPDNYNISWPYWTSQGNGEQDIDTIAYEFGEAIGRRVTSGSYHSGERSQTDNYRVETDGSLEGDSDSDSGLEFISPPLPINEMFDDLDKVIEWAKEKGCYTGASNHTGLHMNVSIEGKGTEDLDYVKLALFLGDEYVLEQFDRVGNTYCKSAVEKIRYNISVNPTGASEALEKMRKDLNYIASSVIHGRYTNKYTSINVKDNYVEFRSPGGDWLNSDIELLKNTLLRFVVALDIASDENKFKEEYGKKLYKLLAPTAVDSQSTDTVRFFAQYSAGKLPKAALKSFVKNLQLGREATKQRPGLDGKKYWWRVTNPANNAASIEVVADSQEAAVARAVMPGNYPEWAGVQNNLRATAVRPYEEEGRSHPAAQRYAPDSASGSTLYKIYSNDNPETIIAAFWGRTGDMDGARMQFRNKLRAMGIENPAGYGFRAIDDE